MLPGPRAWLGLRAGPHRARPTTSPTIPRSRCAVGEPASPAACRQRTTSRAAPRSRRKRRPGGAAGPARAAWSSRRPAPRAPDDFLDSSALALRSREAGARSRVPSANHAARCSAKSPEEAARRLCWARSRGAVISSACAARARRLPRRLHARAARPGGWRAQPRDVSEPRCARLREANGGGGPAVLLGPRARLGPAPYASDDCPDSSARALRGQGGPGSPAACRQRTTLRAAPRCRRRRQPGGATGPACAAWTSHRPAPRASDDVPDCKTP